MLIQRHMKAKHVPLLTQYVWYNVTVRSISFAICRAFNIRKLLNLSLIHI